MTDCQTTRGMCGRAVAFEVHMLCCNKRVHVCAQHAQEGKKEWDRAVVALGLVTYECGHCGREHMPKPVWSAL